MKNSEQLKNFMRVGRVYRRGELTGVTTAVDRDLKTLVDGGDIVRLDGGLYWRPERGARGGEAPDRRDMVRAFLKTDDFMFASHDPRLVYNRRRGGEFRLGAERLRLRVVRTYPAAFGGAAGRASMVRDRAALRVVGRKDEPSDLDYWLAKSPAERVAAVEFLREQYYALAGYKSLPRLAHAVQLRGMGT